MKTIKFRYVLVSIIFGLALLLTLGKEDYSLPMQIFLGFNMIMSILFGIKDRYTHGVYEGNKLIQKFDSEKEALEFADNQARNVRVLMMHIK